MKKVNLNTIKKIIEEEKEKDLIWYNHNLKLVNEELNTLYENDTMYLITKLYKTSKEYCYYIVSEERLNSNCILFTDLDSKINIYKIVR